jgi:hypothetical protein
MDWINLAQIREERRALVKKKTSAKCHKGGEFIKQLKNY